MHLCALNDGRSGYAGIRPDAAPKSLVRMAEGSLAALILVMIAPALLLIAILIKLDGGPLLVAAPSSGRQRSSSATAWTFRVTRHTGDTTRLTLVGRWLSAHSLDELPRLFSIFTGRTRITGANP